MEDFLETTQKILGDLPMYITLAVGLFSSVAAIAALIPGDQPEKFLYKLISFLEKFSTKPKNPE